MKNIRLSYFSLIGFLSLYALNVVIVGCAGTPTAKSSVSSLTDAKMPVVPGIKIKLLSTYDVKKPSRESCPSSEKSWSKEKLPQLLELANNCAQIGAYDRVEKFGNFISQKHNTEAWGPYYLSLAAESKNDYARALWMIELALKKSPNEALLFYQKGRLLIASHEEYLAVESFKTATQKNPKFTDAQFFLAQWSFQNQDFKSADKYFSSVIEARPDNAEALAGLAESKIHLKDNRSAAIFYERAVDAKPRNIGYRLKLADLYENSEKDNLRALALYKRIKSLVSEARHPAEDLPLNINDKISQLEKAVALEEAKNKKISKAEEKNKRKVEK